ncbi:Zinc finger, LIM-type [Sesbania bispinosa]|nr:Zinc finger, LIM-type [Sesbania bispinosa]
MGWLSRIFKGTDHKVSEGHYYKEEADYYLPSTSGMFGPRTRMKIDRAIALSLVEENQKVNNVNDYRSQLEEDELLARAIEESLNLESPPRYGNDNNMYQPIRISRWGTGMSLRMDDTIFLPQHMLPLPDCLDSGFLYFDNVIPLSWICAGCNTEIGYGRYLNCLNAFWHPECFRCRACNLPISDYEFSTSGNYPYHKSCYKEATIQSVMSAGTLGHFLCSSLALGIDVYRFTKLQIANLASIFQNQIKPSFFSKQIPTNHAGLIEYRAHPFWIQKYCPSHEHDNTPRCCSCERMEPQEAGYIALKDGRKLCLECLDSAIMDTSECQPLYADIQKFYESLNMRLDQQIPLLLVERQALNEAREGEKNGHYHMPETRGLCLSEELSTISRRPRHGTGNRALDTRTQPYKLTSRCDVTAILILYGLPRLLTGSILAHEMMHAWLRLKGFRTLSQDVEEGICQVLAHMWLESELSSASGSNFVSTSSSSASYAARKGKRPDFERKLGEFFKHQIESDISPVYGDGFRAGYRAVRKYGLQRTLHHIRMTGSFPYEL